MNHETTLEIVIPPTENFDDLSTISASSEASFFLPELEIPDDCFFIDFPFHEDYRPPPPISLRPLESPESPSSLELEDDQCIFKFEG